MKYTMMDDNTQQEHFNMGLLTLLSVHIIGLLITQSASAIPITCTQTNTLWQISSTFTLHNSTCKSSYVRPGTRSLETNCMFTLQIALGEITSVQFNLILRPIYTMKAEPSPISQQRIKPTIIIFI